MNNRVLVNLNLNHKGVIMTTQFKRIEKAADVSKAIVSISNRAKKLDHDIHVVGVSCMWHADQHGDVTLMQALINALGKSQRRNALIEWSVAYGKFALGKKVGDSIEACAEGESGNQVVFDKKRTTDLPSAEAITPWEFKPEPDFKPFDLHAELEKFMKRASKAAESNDSRNKIDPETLADLAKLVGSK